MRPLQLVYCDCGTHDASGHPRPAPYVMNPHEVTCELPNEGEGHRDLNADGEEAKVPCRPEPIAWMAEQLEHGEWKFQLFFTDETLAKDWQARYPKFRRLIPLAPIAEVSSND